MGGHVALVRCSVAANYLRYNGIVYNKADIIDFVDDPETLGRWLVAGLVTQEFTAREDDNHKYDVALVPTSLASTNLTGPYYTMAAADRAVFVCDYGPVVTTGTVNLEVFQAKNVAGLSAVAILNASAITNATEVTHVAAVKNITLATMVSGTTVTITAYKRNSTTAIPLYPKIYTAGGATDVTTRTFQVGAGDTADAAQLVVCLNDVTYGTPEIFWASAAGVVTGQVIDDLSTFTITCSVDDATDVRTQPQGKIIVEVDRNAITWASGFGWVAAKVTTTATIVCGVTLIRVGAAFSPNAQQTDVVPVSIIR